jgi:hypothetical protein
MIAESWCGLLRAAGIDCRLQPGDAVGFLGVSVFPVRLMVRESDVELAQTVLDTYIAEDEEPPGAELDGDDAPEFESTESEENQVEND